MAYISAIDILDSLVAVVNERLNSISWDKSNNPHETTVQVRHKSEHWIAYTGSNYLETQSGFDEFGNPNTVQIRELEFASYVRVIDLKNDHRRALSLHQLIMFILNGFTPDLDDIKTPLTLKNDNLMSPRGEETTFRYQALYAIQTNSLSLGEWNDPVYIQKVLVNLYASDVDYVGVPERSSFDSVIQVNVGD